MARPHPRRRPRRRHRAHPDGRPRRPSRSWPACSRASSARTGVPVVVNTSLNTAGRPMVDDPRDALECFGSAPVDLLAHRALRRAPSPLAPGARRTGRRAPRRGGGRVSFDVVIPTTGRPSLGTLLAALAAQAGPAPERVVVVDDRPGRAAGAHVPTALRDRTVVARTGPAARASGRGPAAARNAGWRAGAAPWIAFLDDDVVLPAGWTRALAADLERAAGRRRRPARAASSSRSRADGAPPTGSATSPASRTRAGRRPTWPTGAPRWRTRRRLRRALPARLPRGRRPRPAARRARVDDRARGAHGSLHPVAPAGRWVSLRAQAGNADDALMRRLHGRDWRRRAGAPAGRLAAPRGHRRRRPCRRGPGRRRAPAPGAGRGGGLGGGDGRAGLGAHRARPARRATRS